jgi:intracellular multiplication protein IcmP
LSAAIRRHLRLVPPARACSRIGSGAGSQAGQTPDPAAAGSAASVEPRPADYALSPEEWIPRFATALDAHFDEAAARRASVRQLGPRWRGLQEAGPQIRCLFAAFALHLAVRRREALRLLGDLSASLGDCDQDNPEGPDTPLALPESVVREADILLGDGELVTPTLVIANRHAYTHTGLMELLNQARAAGRRARTRSVCMAEAG